MWVLGRGDLRGGGKKLGGVSFALFFGGWDGASWDGASYFGLWFAGRFDEVDEVGLGAENCKDLRNFLMGCFFGGCNFENCTGAGDVSCAAVNCQSFGESGGRYFFVIAVFGYQVDLIF